MLHGSVALSAVALSFYVLTAGFAASAQTEERIYGRQLMTEQEALKYRQKMRAVTSDEERQQIRAEYQQQMQDRAKSRGILLLDKAPVRGMGSGQGMARGPGQDISRGTAGDPDPSR